MRNPSYEYIGDLPFTNDEDYLETLFAYINIYLLDYIERNIKDGKRRKRAEKFLKARLEDNGIRDRFNIADWEQMLQERQILMWKIGLPPMLEVVLNRINGWEFMRRTLIFVLMTTLDKGYQVVLRALDKENPVVTAALCVQLFTNRHITSDMQIYNKVNDYREQFVNIFPALDLAGDIFDIPLRCDTRLIDILSNNDQHLPNGALVFDKEETEEMLFRKEPYELLERMIQKEDKPLLLIWGEKGAGKRLLLKHLAVKHKLKLIFYDITEGYDSNGITSLKGHILPVIRECVLFDEYLILTSIDRMDKEDAKALAGWLSKNAAYRVPGIFLIYEAEEYKYFIENAFAIELGALNELEKIEIWKYYLNGYETEEGFELEPLANTFDITPGQIINAIKHAALMQGNEPILKEDLLYRACYIQLDHELAQNTVRVKTSFKWEDLKMDASGKEILRDICHCVRNRHTVLKEWNFGKIIPYGGGITVLFSGPPGTGKTMAAQVIANELHMELYKIDLSQVIDKYVGETEKNIKRIFDQARKSNSILFFDEADAIFNKRLEASGANERFANIESSLLLQCIEEYNGITILATNNFSAMDAAFIRRFKYYLLFKEPDEKVRYEIWKSVFPKEAPVSEEVDFHELAHTFEFTGAVIKNIALAAAYLAVDRHREIGLTELLKATQREMAKNNLILTREKLGPLGYLFDDTIIKERQ